MGRGRAKAKQTKVARRLKYYSPDTDLSALERELRSQEEAAASYAAANPVDDSDADVDHYAVPDEDDTPGSRAAGDR